MQILDFIHPNTLEQGKVYLRKTGSVKGYQLLPVQFVDYSACPAVVIICNGTGRARCPRHELYLSASSSQRSGSWDSFNMCAQSELAAGDLIIKTEHSA